MNSTGNDIVSLNAIDIASTQQPRFYSKILCAAEVALYKAGLATIPFEHYVWLLWSIKESAYKFLQRNNADLIFSPTKFIVEQLEMPEYITTLNSSQIEGSGFAEMPVYKSVVNFGCETLFGISIVTREFIFSVVNHNDSFDDTCWGVQKIAHTDSQSQSIAVRNILINKLKETLSFDGLVITKNQHCCPILNNCNDVINIPISMAHHDQWVGYSFQLNEVPAALSF